MNHEVSPVVAYAIILGIIGAFVGFVIHWITKVFWFVILVCAVVGLLLGMVWGDNARKKRG